MPLGPFDPIPPREKIRRSHINDLRTALTGIQDAYDVAVANGFVGTRGQWLDSLKGEKGDPGAGLAPIGSVETVDDLPEDGNTVGDVRTVDADGRAYRWDGSAWIDVGLFRGPGGLDTELRARVDPGAAGSNGKVLGWADDHPDWVDLPEGGSALPFYLSDYGVVADGTDETTKVQAAIADATVAMGGADGSIVMFWPPGTVLTGELEHDARILHVGLGGSITTEVKHIDGEATPLFHCTGITYPNTVSSSGFVGMRLVGGDQTTDLIYYDGTPDAMTKFDDLQFRGANVSDAPSGSTTNGINVPDVLNLHMRRVRWDHIGGWGVMVRPDSPQFGMAVMSIDGFTYDNQGGASVGSQTWGYGLLSLDVSNYTISNKVQVNLANGSIELNSGLEGTPPSRGLIRVKQNSTVVSNTFNNSQVQVHFDTVVGKVQSSNAERGNLKIVSVDIGDVAIYGDLTIYNAREIYNNDTGTARSPIYGTPEATTRVTIPYPEDSRANIPQRSLQNKLLGVELSHHETLGQLKDTNSFFGFGAISLMRGAARYFAAVATQARRGRHGPPGSAISLTTGSITSDSTTLTVAAVTNTRFVPGQVITVAGAGSGGGTLTAMIVSVDYNAKTATLDTAAGTTVSGAAVAVAPVSYAVVPIARYGKQSWGGDVPAGESATFTVSVPGVDAFAPIAIGAPWNFPNDAILSANVSDMNNSLVKVRVHNPTASTLTVPSGDFRVVAFGVGDVV